MTRAMEPSPSPNRLNSGTCHPIEPFASSARPVRVIVGVGAVLSSDRQRPARTPADWVKILTPPRGKPRLSQLHGPRNLRFLPRPISRLKGTCPMNSADYLADNPYARFGDLA